jgi:hypothetical protein
MAQGEWALTGFLKPQRPFGGARQGLDKNRENNPMQS